MSSWLTVIHVVLVGLLTGCAAYVVIRLMREATWKERGVRVAAVAFCVTAIAYVLLLVAA